MNKTHPFCKEIPYIKDLFQGNLYAGHIPGFKDTEHTKQDVQDLKRHHITHIISLCEPNEFDQNKFADIQRIAALWEPERCILSQNERTSFSIPDYTPPSLKKAQQICLTIDHHLTQGHNLYLHCAGGLGRTGTILCFYLKHTINSHPDTFKSSDDVHSLILWLRANYHPKAIESKSQLDWLQKHIDI